MISLKQAIIIAFTTGLAGQAHAQVLDNAAAAHRLAIRETEPLQFQGYSSNDEKMPGKCNSVCDKFWSINAKCRVMDGVEWQECVCTVDNFEAWKSCAACAPEYYDIHEDGFVGLFTNGLDQCAGVNLPVNVEIPDASTFSAAGKTGNFVKAPTSDDGTSIRMGGSKFSSASSSFIVSVTAGVAVPCVLAASLLF